MLEKKEKKPTIDGVRIIISHDQQVITSTKVALENDNMIIIMPKYKVMTFKKKLYWFANILYRYWD
jgi:hypothetical protein